MCAFAVKAEDEGFRRLVYLGDLIELPLSGMAVTDHKLQTQREQVRKSCPRYGARHALLEAESDGDGAMLSDYLHITPGQSARAYDASINSFQRRRYDFRQRRAAGRATHEGKTQADRRIFR